MDRKVVIMDHPLIQHKLSILRDKHTSVKEFRELISEIAMLMCFEATRDLPLEEIDVETPVATAHCKHIAGKKLAIVPILRAGLGFEDGILGHKAGDEFDIHVTFPERYHAKDLAGKAVVFKIKLHEVKYKELPALDDELAKDCSEYDTLDEFKASIRKNNQEQLDKQDDLAVENALVDQVIESMEGEIPQAMYDVRMDEMVNDFAFRMEQQGLRLEDYLKYMGQSVDQFRASFMPQAEKQVKIRLALEAVAAAENIEASEEEVSAEIKRIADQYKMEEDKVRELINLEDLKQDLARTKAIDFIKSHANIVEKAAEAEKTEAAQ